MRNHVRILGTIYVVTCGPALLIGTALCVLLSLYSNAENQKSLLFIGPPFLIVACCGLLPGLIGGIGLLYWRAWARRLVLFLSVLLLPLLPVGSALGVYGFWTLMNPETYALFTRAEYRVSEPFVRERSGFFNLLGVMAMVAAGFFLVLKAGFIMHNTPQPALIENRQWTVTALFICIVGGVFVTVLGVKSGSRAMGRARMRREAKAVYSQRTQERYRRAEELAADPARAKYAPLVKQGEAWSDEQITYYETPSRTVTCEHLQPMERAMRAAGIEARFYRNQDILTKCRIDYEGLKREFPVAPPIRYAEFYQGDRDGDEYPTAFLICDEHKSIIHTKHPEEAGAKDAAWFPS